MTVLRIYLKRRILLRSALFLLALMTLALSITACAGNEKASTASAEPAAATGVIRISIDGMFTPKESYSVYSQLLDYIAEKTGHPTVLQQTGSYSEVNDLLAHGGTDVAILCSGGYIKAFDKLGLPPLVAPVANGQPLYYSYIVTRSGSGIRKFEQLRGHPFAFSDPISLTGTLYPESRVVGLGYQPSAFFSHIVVANSHDNSIKALKEGVVDGVAVDSYIYDYMKANEPASVSGLDIIEKSPPFGSPPLVTRPGMPKGLRNQLLSVLTGMDSDPQGKQILSKLRIERFIPVDKSLYDSVGGLEANLVKAHVIQ